MLPAKPGCNLTVTEIAGIARFGHVIPAGMYRSPRSKGSTMAKSPYSTKNAAWIVVLIVIGIAVVSMFFGIAGEELWRQLLGAGILIIVALVVIYFWRRDTGKRSRTDDTTV